MIRPAASAFRFLPLLLAAGLVVPSSADAAGEIDLAERIRDFRAASNGAASETSRRLLAELRDELTGAPVVFRGPISNFSTYGLPATGELESPRGMTALSWAYRGRKVLPGACEGVDPQECARVSAAALRTALPKGEHATMVIVRHDQLVVYALTQDQALVDRLRRGMEVEMTLHSQGMLEHTVFAVLIHARPLSGKLLCPEGHAFDAGSGFTFCPRCGKPLEHRE